MKINDPSIKKMLKIYLEKNQIAIISKWFNETSDILVIYNKAQVLDLAISYDNRVGRKEMQI